MWITITQEQLDRWEAGDLIQDVVPYLSPDEREFIMTGLTPREWEMLFRESEKE